MDNKQFAGLAYIDENTAITAVIKVNPKSLSLVSLKQDDVFGPEMNKLITGAVVLESEARHTNDESITEIENYTYDKEPSKLEGMKWYVAGVPIDALREIRFSTLLNQAIINLITYGNKPITEFYPYEKLGIVTNFDGRLRTQFWDNGQLVQEHNHFAYEKGYKWVIYTDTSNPNSDILAKSHSNILAKNLDIAKHFPCSNVRQSKLHTKEEYYRDLAIGAAIAAIRN